MRNLFLMVLGFAAVALTVRPAQAEDRKYTLQDLQVLEKNQGWDELLKHIQDVPPAARQADWNRVMEHACLAPHNADDDYHSEWCAGQLKSLVLSEPQNTDLAWKAGKWVRLHRASWVAVPFFAKAIAKSGDARCKDEDVLLAVVSGLGLPADSNADVVKSSRDLAFQKCWPASEETLKKAFSESTGYLRDNTCSGMKQKGALSSLQAKRCK